MNNSNAEVDIPDLFDIVKGISDAPAYLVLYVVILGCSALIGTIGNILVWAYIMVKQITSSKIFYL